MILAVDVGNTRTCIGDSKQNWYISTQKNQTADELKIQLSQFLDISKIDGISLSCVVPDLTTVWKKAFNNVYVLDASHKLFKNAYPYPKEIGSDLVAAAIGAISLYGAPCVVIDFGTATNLTIINDKGEFIGGIIIPGIETSFRALISDASLLGEVEIKSPKTVVGYSTECAIQSGLVLGEAARIDGLIKRIEDELYYKLKVVTTGGWSRLISEHMESNPLVNADLLLEALQIAYKNK